MCGFLQCVCGSRTLGCVRTSFPLGLSGNKYISVQIRPWVGASQMSRGFSLILSSLQSFHQPVRVCVCGGVGGRILRKWPPPWG